jgi:hypothetical protein
VNAELFTKDFFGGIHQVQIKDNRVLESTANHILKLTKRFPNLLDGESMKVIYRKILLAIWWDSGLIPSLGSWDSYSKWVMSDKFIDPELITRSIRILLQKDLIRVSARAIRDGEQHRQRIVESLSKDSKNE